MKIKVPPFTQKELKEWLEYCPDTGKFTWKISFSNRVKVGQIAGSFCYGPRGPRSRKLVNVKGWGIYEHRLAFFWMTGEWPKEEVDHIDGNSLNNEWENLRLVSRAENAKNLPLPVNNTSGVIGVWKTSSATYAAEIKVNQKKIHLGKFKTLTEAAQARKKAEIFYGFHLNHGRNKS